MNNLKIFIFCFNRPDLLQLQLDSFKKYLIGNCDINIVYDYREDLFGIEFKKICELNNVKMHYHKSQGYNNPSGYHAESLSWTYKNLINDNDYVIFLDHDIFLIDYFDLQKRLDRFDISGLKQSRSDVHYFWPGLFMFKYSSIKSINFNFYPQQVDGESLDSGGGTYKLTRNENLKINFVSQQYPDYYKSINLKDISVNNGYVFEIFDNDTFLHTKNACHWHNGYQVNDSKKTKIIFEIMEEIISNN